MNIITALFAGFIKIHILCHVGERSFFGQELKKEHEELVAEV